MNLKNFLHTKRAKNWSKKRKNGLSQSNGPYDKEEEESIFSTQFFVSDSFFYFRRNEIAVSFFKIHVLIEGTKIQTILRYKDIIGLQIEALKYIQKWRKDDSDLLHYQMIRD